MRNLHAQDDLLRHPGVDALQRRTFAGDLDEVSEDLEEIVLIRPRLFPDYQRDDVDFDFKQEATCSS